MNDTTAAMSFEIKDLDVELGGRLILKDVNLAAREGEFVCIVGRSGCGKTSLLRTIGNLIEPTRGSVVVAPSARKHGTTTTDCAIVFQADSLFPWMTVERNAMFGLRSRGVATNVARERANTWLTRVGLPDEVIHLKPRQLSGGMRQRVNLVRALALEPKVILMDEPFASLDYQTREELQVEIMRLSGLNSMTTVFVTHDVPEAVLLSDRVVVMDLERKGISEIFEMPWGRDRSLELKATSAFADMCGKLSHAVRSS